MPRRGNCRQEGAFRSVHTNSARFSAFCSCLLDRARVFPGNAGGAAPLRAVPDRDRGHRRWPPRCGAARPFPNSAQLQEQAPTGAIGRARPRRADRDRLPRALQSRRLLGRHRAHDHRRPAASDAPDLADRLERLGDRRRCRCVVAVDKGEAYRIASISVRSATPEGAAAVAAAADDLRPRASATRRARSRCWRRSAACWTGCWPPATRWRRSPGGKPW